MTEAPALSASALTAGDLRVLRHLKGCTSPITAYELARALGWRTNAGSGQNRAKACLRRLERAGLVRQVEGTKALGDARPAVRWVAT